MDDHKAVGSGSLTHKTNPVKRKGSVKCSTLKTKVVPRGGPSSAKKVTSPKVQHGHSANNAEQQNELEAILNKRKARSECTGPGSSVAAASRGNTINDTLIKQKPKIADKSVAASKLPTSITADHSCPNTPNLSSRELFKKPKDISKSETAASQGFRQALTNFERQKSDQPPPVSVKPKPLSKIRSSPNMGSDVVSADSRQDTIPEASESPTHKSKALRDNLFLTIDHNKRLSSASSPGSSSPRWRSRSPTPVPTEERSETASVLRSKSPALPPKPKHVRSPSDQSLSEPCSKRSSSSSDKTEDSVGDKFISALKSKFETLNVGNISKSTETLPTKPTKPSIADKPKLSNKTLPQTRLATAIKNTESIPSTSTSAPDKNNVCHEIPPIPTRAKKTSVPNKPVTENAELSAKTQPILPPKKPVIEPARPQLPEQDSTSSDYYEDVEVLACPALEGDRDSGRGSTECAKDIDKRSSGTDSWSSLVDDEQNEEHQLSPALRYGKRTRYSVKHRHSSESKKTRRQISPKPRFWSNPERRSRLLTYDEVAPEEVSDGWTTDEDEGYEQVIDDVQITLPIAVPMRPPRNTQSPISSQTGQSPRSLPVLPSTPPKNLGPKVLPPPPPKDPKSKGVQLVKETGRAKSGEDLRRKASLNKNVPPPALPSRRRSGYGDSQGASNNTVQQPLRSVSPLLSRPNTPVSKSDEPPPVPPARRKGSDTVITTTTIPTNTPPCLPPRNKEGEASPVKPPKLPAPSPTLTPDTVVPLSPPATLPRLPPKWKSPSPAQPLGYATEPRPHGSRGKPATLVREDAVDNVEGEPQSPTNNNRLLRQVPPPPNSRPGSTTEDGYVCADHNGFSQRPMMTKEGYFPMDSLSFRTESTDSTDSNFNYIDPMRDLESHPDINFKETAAPFSNLWNTQVPKPKPVSSGSVDIPYLELLPEEIEQIQGYVSGQLTHQGDSARFIDEPLYQIYHCGATVRNLHRQSDQDDYDDDKIYDYEEAASYVTEAIYGNLEEVTGCAFHDADESEPSVFATTIQSLVKAGSNMRTLWSEMDEVKESGLLTTLTMEQKRMQETLFELITSEASYLKSLNILISNFYESEQFSNCLDSRDKHTLFSNAVAVRDVSSRFMGALETFWRHHVLLDFAILDLVNEFCLGPFNVYVIYCSNQTFQERTLKRLRADSELFKKVISHLEQNELCQGLPMQSFLTLPMQRITRLPLLVDAVCHRMDSSSSEYEKATRTLHNLQKLVKQCNEGAQRMLNIEEITAIDKSLNFKHIKTIPIVSQSRSIVKNGPLIHIEKVRDGKGRPKKKENKYLYLFNDLLIIAKKKSEDNYQVVDYCPRISVESYMIEDADISKWLGPSGAPKDCRNLFGMVLLENYEQKQSEYIFACDSPSERMRWIEATTPSQQITDDERIYEAWDCPQVQAIHQYVAKQADELTLEESDVINVFRKINDGWYEGERIRDGQKGWFPASYTIEIQSAHVRSRNLRQRYRMLILGNKM